MGGRRLIGRRTGVMILKENRVLQNKNGPLRIKASWWGAVREWRYEQKGNRTYGHEQQCGDCRGRRVEGGQVVMEKIQ